MTNGLFGAALGISTCITTLIRKIPVVWFANLKDGITMCIVDHETQQMLHVKKF